jgi:5-methylcytosine-specific restriction endonuclease McrA
MSVSYGTGLKAKATRLHSLVVRARCICAMCGEQEYATLQCAHVIPRRFSATRTDVNAAWCLCWKCHRRTTDHPDDHMKLVDATIGREEFDRLKAKALGGVRTSESFWRAECARLSELLKKVTA